MNGRHGDALSDVTLAHAGIAEDECVVMAFDEARGCEFEDQRAIDAGIERPVERVERLAISQTRLFDASLEEAIAASFEFVVDQQAQEIDWATGPLLNASCKEVSALDGFSGGATLKNFLTFPEACKGIRCS